MAEKMPQLHSQCGKNVAFCLNLFIFQCFRSYLPALTASGTGNKGGRADDGSVRGLEQGSYGFLSDRGHVTIMQGASAMSEPDKNASDSELRARLGSLKSALGQAEKNEKPGASQAGPDGAMAGAMSSGFRAATDLAGGIIAGALIGVLADRWLGTSPFLLIAFLVIGSIAGLRSVYRLGSRPTSGSGDVKPKT